MVVLGTWGLIALELVGLNLYCVYAVMKNDKAEIQALKAEY